MDLEDLRRSLQLLAGSDNAGVPVTSMTAAEFAAKGGAGAFKDQLLMIDGVLMSCNGIGLTAVSTSKQLSLSLNDSSKAAQNSTYLNAVLASGGRAFIYGNPGDILYIGSELILSSNSYMGVAPGVTIKVKDNADSSLLCNKSYTLTPLSLTSLSYAVAASRLVCTAVASAAHGLSVGDYAFINWAGTPGFGGVFKVLTVSTTTVANDTFTYTPKYRPSATPCVAFTGKSITVQKADVNITIDGGIWDYNLSNQGIGHASVFKTHGMLFLGTHGLKIINGPKILNCPKFAIMHAGNSASTIGPVEFDTTSDGIHTYGPSFDAHITDAFGICHDDGVVAQTYEAAAFAAYRISAGDVIGFRAESLDIDSLTGVAAVYTGDDAASPYRLDAKISGYMGNAYRGIHIGGASTNPITKLETDGPSVAFDTIMNTIDGGAAIGLYNVELGGTSAQNANNGIVEIGNSIIGCMNAKMNLNPAPAYSGSHGLIYVTGGTAVIRELNIINPVVNYAAYAAVGFLRLLNGAKVEQCNIVGGIISNMDRAVVVDSGATINNLNIRGIRKGAGAVLTMVRLSGTINRLNLEDIYLPDMDGGAFLIEVLSVTATAKIYGSNINVGTRPHIQWTASSPNIEVYTFDITTDVGLLPLTKDQIATHSSAVAGRNAANQQGKAICNGTNWYALGTGAGGVNTLII